MKMDLAHDGTVRDNFLSEISVDDTALRFGELIDIADPWVGFACHR